ncbi:hypothetical protein LFL96_22170 [Paraburkholderia sp. D15]|uniref:hypothetical protein n=1 Tax=Paraburkholderia sp. D15 TaxID=2880218 RepID=UPI00247B21A1|nr:hypothetical protein [Paraburkholderia sp. D15]WGS53754.1 hypothetical protein LFL96_22170 [Paraburkholderia sp. D15]
MEQAYAAIGRAVIAMQMFEVAFVSIHEGFKMITDPAYLQTTGGMIEEGRYKNATANVVKALSQHGQIAADLEDQLNTLIDRRNELMHRWFLRNGWPANDDNDPASYEDVIRLAQWVRTEADAITRMMASYMLKYAAPDQHARNPEAVNQAVAEMFHRVHVQG